MATVKSEQSVFFWNAVSYVLYALQSAILLFFISHMCTVEEAGIFSFSFALASLLLCVASYGMRNYQVADIQKKYSFTDYKHSRLLTYGLAIILCFGTVFVSAYFKEYSGHKIMIIILVCLYKYVEAAEDVFHGYYQQKGGLIYAARILSYRLFLSDLLFGVLIFVSRDLLISLLATVLFTYGYAVYSNKKVMKIYGSQSKVFSPDAVKGLLLECLPLCVSQFLVIYITNISKYAMDGVVTEQEQAFYGYLSMPVFVISLLSNIIFTPYLLEYAKDWKEGRKKKFSKEIALRCVVIMAITVVTTFLGELIGLKILSVLYNAELTVYSTEFMFLLLGGGMSAICTAMNFAITVVGYQKSLFVAYVFVAGVGTALAPFLVRRSKIAGASFLMTFLFTCEAFILILLWLRGMKKGSKKHGGEEE